MSDVPLAFVTGGASGIGSATVELLLERGWRVAAADRDADRLAELAGRLARPVHELLTLPLDVTDGDAVAAAVGASAEAGPLRGIVTCAGIAPAVPFLETPADVFLRTLEVNLLGTFLVAQAAAPHLHAAGGGAIVTIASVSGFRGSPRRASYGASKGGVLTLTKTMALELAPLGIRVNCVAPGATETPLLAQVHDRDTRAGVMAALPLRRYAHPREQAAAIAFLLEEESASFVTGQTIVVDGGQMAGAGWTLPELETEAALS